VNRTALTVDTPLEASRETGRESEKECFFLYTDQTLTCRDCGQSFTFTASEQDFYAQRGFSNPLRCPSCRASRKAQRNESGGGGYSSSGSGFGNGGGYGGGSGYSSGGGYDRGPRQMYTATCSSCGKDAQVPFQPTSGKPVYCSDCFRSRR
jgi:CxxC-x17-CxxC domain-containing protein